MALLGRVLTCGLLAVAWQRLAMHVAPRAWLAVLSAALFVCFNSRLHMAGEWAVGGLESKGFAYALVFAALAALVRGRWSLAWILLGAATAIHPLVGGWSLLAAAFAWCWSGGDGQRPRLIRILPAMALAVVLGLVGLWPAMQLSAGVDPQVAAEARWIQVFHRLPHHLNPSYFLWRRGWLDVPFGVRFLALAILWLGLARGLRDLPNRRLSAFVLGGLAIAAAGLAIAVLWRHQPYPAARLLRFYWFRLADVLLPAGAALAVTARILQWQAIHPWRAGLLLAAGVVVAVGHGTDRLSRHARQVIPAADRKTAGTVQQLADWREVCDHIRRRTPPDAVCIVPRWSHTFKWYAERGEVGTWKEMPQDAASVVEWWRRLQALDPGPAVQPRSRAQLPPHRLRELAAEYGATYLVTDARPALPFPRLVANDSYAVYQLFPPRRGSP